MGLSRWHRFGYWLETFGLGRRLVLRYDASWSPSPGVTRHRYINRINGHVTARTELTR